MREMKYSDLPSVEVIEQSAQANPWSELQFRESITAGHLCLVEEVEGDVCGYAVLMPAVDNADLLTIAVAPGQQRKGIGGRLLDALFDWGRTHGMLRIFLEVRRSNESAIALYKAKGFVQAGVRWNYYRNAQGREDALIMCRELIFH